MAGHGGQGVLTIGTLLAYAALEANLEATWFPQYAPAVRGGTSNCTVIIADGPVGSPISGRPGSELLLNASALEHYERQAREGGLIIVNSSLATRPVSRTDVTAFSVPANALAAELGNERTLNMVMLGAYLEAARPFDTAVLEAALRVSLPERHHKHIPANLRALEVGAQCVREQRES